MADLNRLICPRSIAVVGGGAWCEHVIHQTELMGFDGAIWPVHHKVAMVAGYGAFPSVQDLPEPPDAVFVGVNRHASVDIVEQLAQLGAGGAVCLAQAGRSALPQALPRLRAKMPVAAIFRPGWLQQQATCRSLVQIAMALSMRWTVLCSGQISTGANVWIAAWQF